MAFRIVQIESEVKISLKLENLIIEKNDEDEIWIPLADINVIVVDNLSTRISSRMLVSLAEYNIVLIICNEKHLPCSEFVPLSNHARASKILNYQISLSNEEKDKLWTDVVIKKMINQKENLKLLNKSQQSIDKITLLIEDTSIGDVTNREGFVAKVYFNELMGCSFSRGNDEILLNSALDYGYAIIRSLVARCLVAYGLNCQIGIHHRSEYNEFNLADDMMEPIRPIFDNFAYKLMDGEEYFKLEHRHSIINFLNHLIKYNNKKMYISNMIEEYIEQFQSIIVGNKRNIILPDINDYIGVEDEI